jgi:nudix-type nucleoside diphosphatase (YffH/AdpP family)
MTSIFFYGSLRDAGLLEIVLGRRVDPDQLEPARAEGFAARSIRGEVYPVLLPVPGRQTEGLLLHNPSERDVSRLSYYEEAEYRLMPITVEAGSGPCEAQYFSATEKPSVLDEDWDFARWQRDHHGVAVETALEYMDHAAQLPVELIDTIWPGIKIRGIQRARALANAPQLGSLRTGFGPGDVEIRRMRRAYTSYLAVQELSLRHRRFDGEWTPELDRSVTVWGDAVTLLPYDPRRDRVLLIEQFRPGPAARGDLNPWCIEVIAGRIDNSESPETTARREAREEAGLEIGRIAATGGYYTTPGLAAEHLTGFVGEANLDGAGGMYGLECEGEDIRAVVLTFEQAMADIGAGAVNSGPALVALLWLAANRDRLRAEWAVPVEACRSSG